MHPLVITLHHHHPPPPFFVLHPHHWNVIWKLLFLTLTCTLSTDVDCLSPLYKQTVVGEGLTTKLFLFWIIKLHLLCLSWLMVFFFFLTDRYFCIYTWLKFIFTNIHNKCCSHHQDSGAWQRSKVRPLPSPSLAQIDPTGSQSSCDEGVGVHQLTHHWLPTASSSMLALAFSGLTELEAAELEFPPWAESLMFHKPSTNSTSDILNCSSTIKQHNKKTLLLYRWLENWSLKLWHHFSSLLHRQTGNASETFPLSTHKDSLNSVKQTNETLSCVLTAR